MSGDEKKMPEVEIEGLKSRVDNMEKRFDKVDTSLEKMWSKIDEQKTSQTVTHTLLEVLSKSVNESRIESAKVLDKLSDKMDGIKTDMATSEVQRVKSESSNNEKQSGKWETLWSKIATGVLGILVTILLVKLGFK